MSRAELQRFGAVLAVSVLAIALHLAGTRGQIVFVVAAVALAALAWALAEATDQAGESAGPRASALLNATFGNLPEVVIVVLAIRAGLDDIARASIIGSVIGNILLVLGLSLVVGGWRNGAQTFSEKVAATNASMLILGVAGLGLPTLFAALEHDPQASETLSLWTGGALVPRRAPSCRCPPPSLWRAPRAPPWSRPSRPSRRRRPPRPSRSTRARPWLRGADGPAARLPRSRGAPERERRDRPDAGRAPS